jgi:hypothetical protein
MILFIEVGYTEKYEKDFCEWSKYILMNIAEYEWLIITPNFYLLSNGVGNCRLDYPAIPHGLNSIHKKITLPIKSSVSQKSVE